MLSDQDFLTHMSALYNEVLLTEGRVNERGECELSADEIIPVVQSLERERVMGQADEVSHLEYQARRSAAVLAAESDNKSPPIPAKKKKRECF